jgi:hypothetical protein
LIINPICLSISHRIDTIINSCYYSTVVVCIFLQPYKIKFIDYISATSPTHNTNTAPTNTHNSFTLPHHHAPVSLSHHHNGSTALAGVSIVQAPINTSIPRHPSATIMTTASRHSRLVNMYNKAKC